MGYLNKTSITVDATLTKMSRKLMAQGRAIDIAYFTLCDTGVDYTMWDPNHPCGSAFYGEAIENAPNIEALGDPLGLLKNKLVTFERPTAYIPVIKLLSDNINFAKMPWKHNLQPEIFPQGAVSNPKWLLVVSDKNLLKISGTPVANYDEMINFHLGDTMIANTGAYTGPSFKIEPYKTAVTRTGSMLLMETSSGIHRSLTFRIENNLESMEPTLTNNPKG